MRLVDHQKIERRHRIEIAGSRQRRNHREGHLSLPGLFARIDDGRPETGHDTAELFPVLVGEFVAMGEDASLGIGIDDHAPRDSREHDRLAGPGRGHGERVSMLRKRADASLDEQFLTGSQQHA